MKNHFAFLFLVLASCFLSISGSFGQAPQGMNYQAVARDATGAILLNQNIGLRLTITDGNGGAVLYQETQTTATNQFGLFTLNLGNGTVVTGTFPSITWGSVSPWLQVEMDPAGGTSYTDMGTSQLLSVPYSLFAGKSGDNKWIATGSDIYNTNSGNVGIGTTVPSVKLDVSKTGTGMAAKFNTTDQIYLGLYEGNTYRGYIGSYYGNAEDIDVGSQTGAVHLVNGSTIAMTANAGDIGIGTTAPSTKLDIENTGTGQTLRLNAASDVFLGFWEGGGYRGYVGSYYGALNDIDLGSLVGAVHLVTGSTIDLTAKSGKVGIGTVDPMVDLHVWQQSNVSEAGIRVTANNGTNGAALELERFAANMQWRITNEGSSNGVAGDLIIQSAFFKFLKSEQ